MIFKDVTGVRGRPPSEAACGGFRDDTGKNANRYFQSLQLTQLFLRVSIARFSYSVHDVS
jgi:hypothetical protein